MLEHGNERFRITLSMYVHESLVPALRNQHRNSKFAAAVQPRIKPPKNDTRIEGGHVVEIHCVPGEVYPRIQSVGKQFCGGKNAESHGDSKTLTSPGEAKRIGKGQQKQDHTALDNAHAPMCN